MHLPGPLRYQPLICLACELRNICAYFIRTGTTIRPDNSGAAAILYPVITIERIITHKTCVCVCVCGCGWVTYKCRFLIKSSVINSCAPYCCSFSLFFVVFICSEKSILVTLRRVCNCALCFSSNDFVVCVCGELTFAQDYLSWLFERY